MSIYIQVYMYTVLKKHMTNKNMSMYIYMHVHI